LIALNLRLDVIVLSLFRPASDVGLFSAANVLSSGFFLLASLMVSVIFPKLSRLARQSQTDFRDYVETLLKLSLFFLIPISTIVFFGAPLIVRILYGSRYSGAAPLLKILAFSVPLIFLNAIFFYAFVARGKRSSYLWVMASGVLFNLVLNPLLTWQFGYAGTALSNLLRETGLLVLFTALALHEHSLLFSAAILTRSAGSLAAHTVLGLGLLQLGVGALQALGIVLSVYLGVMFVSKGLPKKSDLALLARHG
ncbi:MAG: oligosaccharide flippase family protein, partial [Acidobacteria bacterium]|nr:oligosaccharide flippase family protein [Acidobacteriota bacterium]